MSIFPFWAKLLHLGARREAERMDGRKRDVYEDICVCMSLYVLIVMGVYMCMHLQTQCLWASPCIPVCSLSLAECLIFLNHCKHTRALLTMPLRVNAQNNFQLKIRFSGKSEFHAYYCRINADPHSTSTWRRKSLAETTNSLFKHSTECVYTR